MKYDALAKYDDYNFPICENISVSCIHYKTTLTYFRNLLSLSIELTGAATLGKDLRYSFAFGKTKNFRETTFSLSVEFDVSKLVPLWLDGKGQITNYKK